MEGVEGVITCADVPGEDGFGVFVHDQPVMARGKVRYVGEAVAAVAAEDPLTAQARAVRRSRSCTSRCRLYSIRTRRMRPGAPVLHDYAPDNVTKHIPIRVGDVEKGFAESPTWSSRRPTPRKRSSMPISSRRRVWLTSTTTAS